MRLLHGSRKATPAAPSGPDITPPVHNQRWYGDYPRRFDPPPNLAEPAAGDDVVIADPTPNMSVFDVLSGAGRHRAHRPGDSSAPACGAKWPGGGEPVWALIGSYRLSALNASLCPDRACFGDPDSAAGGAA